MLLSTRRPSLCKAIAVCFGLLTTVHASEPFTLGSVTNCHHGDALQRLNCTTEGRVQESFPFALPCFSKYEGQSVQPDDEACAIVQQQWPSLSYRSNIPGSYMYTQDSSCPSDPVDQCLLDNADPWNPQAYSDKDCRQGSVPPLYLTVTCARDVQAAFDYSKDSGKPLVIKNSGHDNMGHSSRKEALMLWTRGLQTITHSLNFVPAGGSSNASYMAMTIGAGVNCGEAYDYAAKHNFTVVCGYTPTVGMSGGWLQNGGHSVLTPAYGLGIDRVLEFKVVTPDGVYRTANAFQNQDLFWALRGGGGGTFGVVLESTHKVEPATSVLSAELGFKGVANSSQALGFYQLLIEEASKLGKFGWGGHITGTTAVFVNPLPSSEEALDPVRRLQDYALRQGGYASTEQLSSFSTWVGKILSTGNATAGSVGLVASRLIPKATFESKSGRDGLLKIIASYVSAGGKFSLPIGPPTAFAPSTLNSTSATPAWYSSLWHLTLRSSWPWNATMQMRQQTVSKLENLNSDMEMLAPDSGSYMNEASPFTRDWQIAWWGRSNYDSLLAIKRRYDPHRLLLCWKCVGWEEEDAQDFCFQGLDHVK